MKRIVTVGAIVTAFAVAPAVAAAGNAVTQAKPQLQKVRIVDVRMAKVQRAQAAVSMERHLVQVAQVNRFSLLVRSRVR